MRNDLRTHTRNAYTCSHDPGTWIHKARAEYMKTKKNDAMGGRGIKRRHKEQEIGKQSRKLNGGGTRGKGKRESQPLVTVSDTVALLTGLRVRMCCKRAREEWQREVHLGIHDEAAHW